MTRRRHKLEIPTLLLLQRLTRRLSQISQLLLVINNCMCLTDKSYFCASKLSPVSFIDLKALYFFVIKPNSSGLTVGSCSGRFLYVLKSFRYVERQFELTAQWYAKVDWINRFYCDSLWVVASLFIWFEAVLFYFLSGRDKSISICAFFMKLFGIVIEWFYFETSRVQTKQNLF